MKLVQINKLFSSALLALSITMVLIADAAELITEKASESSKEFTLHKISRIEVSETDIYLDEFSEAPSFFLGSISESALKVQPDTHSLLLSWSFPQEEHPSITLCLKETSPASGLQLIESKTPAGLSSGPPAMRLREQDQFLTVELDLSASHGQLLLALNNLQIDLRCKFSNWLQDNGDFGRAILADFVAQPTHETSESAVRFNAATKQPPNNKHVEQSDELNTTSETPGNMFIPEDRIPAGEPELTTVSSGSYFNHDDQPPGKRPGMPSHPMQIVILLPAMSHGAAGILDLPDVTFQAFNEEADTLAPNFSGEQLTDEPVVILQVTNPAGITYQVEIDQKDWHLILERNLHRNTLFLYNLASRWSKDKEARKERTTDLLALLEKHHSQMDNLDRRLNEQTPENVINDQINTVEITNFEFETLWQELSQLMPSRLSVVIQQFDQAVTMALSDTLLQALTPGRSQKLSETITIPVKGIVSYSNGTTTSGTGYTQSPPTQSQTQIHNGVFPSSRRGEPSMGIRGNGDNEDQPQDLPPPHSTNDAAPGSFDLYSYLTANPFDTNSAGYQKSDSKLKILSFDLNSYQLSLMLWMFVDDQLSSDSEIALTRRNQLSSNSSHYVRGLIYAFARTLKLDSLLEKIDPLNRLTSMSTEDIIWLTSHHARYLNDDDAFTFIAKLNMLMTAKKVDGHQLNAMTSQIEVAADREIIERCYSPNEVRSNSCEFAVVYTIDTIRKKMQYNRQIPTSIEPLHTVWEAHLAPYLHENNFVRFGEANQLSTEKPGYLLQSAATAQHLSVTPDTNPPPYYTMTPPPLAEAVAASGATSTHRRTPGSKRPATSPAAPPPSKKAAYIDVEQAQTLSLPSVYATLLGLSESEGKLNTEKLRKTVEADLIRLSSRELRQIAFALGVAITDKNRRELSDATVALKIAQSGQERIIGTMKLLLDNETKHNSLPVGLSAKQIVVIIARKLNWKQESKLLNIIVEDHPEVDKYPSSTSPLLNAIDSLIRNNPHITLDNLNLWLLEAGKETAFYAGQLTRLFSQPSPQDKQLGSSPKGFETAPITAPQIQTPYGTSKYYTAQEPPAPPVL